MMKRMLILLASLVLVLGLWSWAAAEETPTPEPTKVPAVLAQPDATPKPYATPTPRPTEAPLPEDVFFANVVEISRRIELLADSERFMRYVDGYQTPEDVLEKVTRGDHTNPVRCWQVRGAMLVQALTGGNAEAAASFDLSRQEIMRSLVQSLPELMTADCTEEEQSLITLFSRYKLFAYDMPTDCGLMILQYADATPVAVTWYAADGAVNAAASFLPDAELEACRTAEEVSAWFASLGLPPVTFEEVTIP